MPAQPSVSATDFKDFSKIGDAEPDTEIESYIAAAETWAADVCGEKFTDLPTSDSLSLAIKLKALSYINQKSFPSKAIMDAVHAQCLSLLAGLINPGNKTVYAIEDSE